MPSAERLLFCLGFDVLINRATACHFDIRIVNRFNGHMLRQKLLHLIQMQKKSGTHSTTTR